MNDYPLPSHACALWIAGETLWVSFPPQPGSDKGHKVAFQADEMGIKNLLVVLRAREGARLHELKVGHKATPTQADVARLRAMAAAVKTTTVVKTTVSPKAKKALEDEVFINSLLEELEIDL